MLRVKKKKICTHKRIISITPKRYHTQPDQPILLNKQRKLSPQQKQIKINAIEQIKVQSNFNNNSFHNQNCVCKQCDCRRHFCSLQSIVQTPKMHFSSVYRTSFVSPINKIHKSYLPIQQKPVKSKSIPITVNTTYGASFSRDNTNNQNFLNIRRICVEPQNNLSAPAQKTTTYSTSFIGHNGPNQYIKVKQVMSPKMSFRGTTNYRKQFIQRKSHSDFYSAQKLITQKYKNINRQINKSNCQSTYQNMFKPPKNNDGQNPQQPKTQTIHFIPQDNLSINHNNISSNEHQPNKSTYQLEYGEKQKLYDCPARVKILKLNQYQIEKMKHRCKDNTNFKQLLISRSKFNRIT